MKDGKKIKYNLIVGLFGQVVTMILGVLVPKLVLTNYGSEVNGLLSSVTNIYAYIAIVEAGIAASSCQALYKAIAEKNTAETNAVLSATNRYYKRSGLIYLALILAFSGIYPVLIQTSIPYITIVLVILFNGLGNVINYFFHGKYLILLKADGKNYVRSGLELFINVFKQVSKIILIAMGYDVVFVQFVAMLANFAQMIYITYYINKHYSWIDLHVKPNFAAISQSRHVFVHEISYLINANIGTVVLTVFTTLKQVSVYSLYVLLFSMINKILQIVKESLEFKVAHVFHTDRDAYQKLFHAFEVYTITLSFVLFTVASYFVLPFLTLYTKDVTDVQYIDKWLPYLFVLTNLLSAGRYPSDAMVHIAGHFQQTRNSAISEALIHIIAAAILVHFYGIHGVLLGALLASIYRTNYLILYVNKNIIGRSPFSTYLCWGMNLLIYLLTQFVNRFIYAEMDSYMQIFLLCVPYTICVGLFYFAIVSLLNPQAFLFARNLMLSLVNKRRKDGRGD